MIEVWHAKQPTFGFAPKPEWPAAFERVAEVATDDLDDAFRLTNHIDRHWTTNSEITLPAGCRPGRLRSTSVGDVLVKEGRPYEVAVMGFQEIARTE